MWTLINPEGLWRDGRHALRGLVRAPLHSTSIVAVLAIAIGANVAIFSLVNALLLRELPVDRPDQLVALKRMSRGAAQGISIPLFEELRGRLTAAPLMAIGDVSAELIVEAAAGADPRPVVGAMVSGNYFRVLRTRAAAGRLLVEEDDRFADPQPVMVLSHAFWTDRFGGDPAIAGRTVLLGGHRFTVVGVAAKELRALGGDRGLGGDYWIPLNMQPVVSDGVDRRRNPGASMLRVMGRRLSGVSIEQLQAEVDVFYPQLPVELARPDSTLQVAPGNRGFGDALARQYWPPLRVLIAGVALLLVMACANVASLLVARSARRQHEIAVRQALGSGRGLVVRQLLVESVLLAAIGGSLGLAWASAGAQALTSLAVPIGAPALDLSLDWNILLFTVAVSLATTLLFGLAPALHLSRRRSESALRAATRGTTGRSRHALNRALIAIQATMAVILVVGAMQFAGSLYRLYAADLGFDRQRMIIVAVDGRPAGYQTPEQYALLARQIVERVSSVPAVESATVAAAGFFGGGRRSTRTYSVDGRPYGAPDDPTLYFNEVSNDYLRAFRVPFVAGRDFDDGDRAGAPRVAVVNELFARRFFPGQSAVGRRFSLDDDRADIAIVGVVRDSKLNDVREDAAPLAFLPFEQFPARFNHVLIKTAGDPAGVLPALRPAVLAIHPRLRVDRVQTLDAALDETLSEDILAARLSAVFGVAAVALVCFGVYGLISYLVLTRTREIGVRLAIGARPGAVLREVVGDAIRTAAPGIAMGILIAAGLERLVASQLFQSRSADPVTFGAAAILLLGVIVVAAYVPARRASRISPVNALRAD